MTEILVGSTNLVAEKLPHDGTVVPKHVEGGTVFHDLFYSILFSAIFCFFKYGK